jgi:hypothetical protein
VVKVLTSKVRLARPKSAAISLALGTQAANPEIQGFWRCGARSFTYGGKDNNIFVFCWISGSAANHSVCASKSILGKKLCAWMHGGDPPDLETACGKSFDTLLSERDRATDQQHKYYCGGAQFDRVHKRTVLFVGIGNNKPSRLRAVTHAFAAYYTACFAGREANSLQLSDQFASHFTRGCDGAADTDLGSSPQSWLDGNDGLVKNQVQYLIGRITTAHDVRIGDRHKISMPTT